MNLVLAKDKSFFLCYEENYKEQMSINDFMFCQVMQDEAICTKVLNILLQDFFDIGTIKVSTSQATIENHPKLKFVHLDVLATDDNLPSQFKSIHFTCNNSFKVLFLGHINI